MSYAKRLDRDEAESLAVQAFGFIASDPERLNRFLALSGIEPRLVRQAAGEPAFLAGVLEHILADEPLLIAFAADAAIDPARVARAHAALGPPEPTEVP